MSARKSKAPAAEPASADTAWLREAISDKLKAWTGKHPGDLVAMVKELGDVLNGLEEVFSVIAAESALDTLQDRTVARMCRIHGLARIARHVAQDTSNWAGCEADDLRDALQQAGAP